MKNNVNYRINIINLNWNLFVLKLVVPLLSVIALSIQANASILCSQIHLQKNQIQELTKKMNSIFEHSITRGDFKDIQFEISDQNGRSIYRFQNGGLTTNAVVPILSASKWISTATIMKLVESNVLSLNDQVGDHISDRLGGSLPGSLAKITLKQLLSFTSGIPGSPEVFLRTDITLEESVHQLFESPSRFEKPGTVFNYNDNHLHVASLMAINALQKKSGLRKSFAEIVYEAIGKPLGISKIEYFAKPRKRQGSENTRAAAGLLLSFKDYQKFLNMIHNYGNYQGIQVLKKTTVEEMERTQVKVPNEEGKFYSLGNWKYCEQSGCGSSENLSPGYSGWLPLINRQLGYTALLGAIETGEASSRSLSLYNELKPIIQDLMLIQDRK